MKMLGLLVLLLTCCDQSFGHSRPSSRRAMSSSRRRLSSVRAVPKSTPRSSRRVQRETLGPKYTIGIIRPRPGVKHTIVNILPDPNIDYKILVIKPYARQSRRRRIRGRRAATGDLIYGGDATYDCLQCESPVKDGRRKASFLHFLSEHPISNTEYPMSKWLIEVPPENWI